MPSREEPAHDPVDQAKVREIAENLAQSFYGKPLAEMSHEESRTVLMQAEREYRENFQPESPAPTPFDDEWLDHKALTYLLLRHGVPIERINGAFGEIRTVEDLATANARLFTLGSEFGLPRDWLVKQVEKKKRSRAQMSTGGTPMSGWFKKAAPGGPEMEHALPTKKRPDFGGPVEDGMPKPEGGPGAPGGPAGAPKPGLPGAKPGPALPGGKPPAGADEIKMLLDKGDLQGALDALKKLLPGGGDKSPAPPHKAPNLGKPAPKPGDKEKEPAKPEPKAAPIDGEQPKKDEKEPKASYASLTWKGDCPTCKNPISIEASSDVEAEAE